MANTKDELFDQWLIATDPNVRERLIQEMMAKGLFPDDTDYEEEYGLYPALEDPEFIQKLFKKREFGENKTDSIEEQMKAIEEGDSNPCDTIVEFEVSPLQRFVKNFLSGKTPYNSALLYHGVGVGKCHGRDTPILMFDGSIKKIQDINIGDILMGDDSTPRNVLSLARGRDIMFEIKTVKKDSYIVNSEHILSLKYTGTNNIIDVPLNEYLKYSNKRKSNLKGYNTGVDFKSKKITFDPYILGVWLGDGSQRDPVISSQDSKILHYLREYSSNNNLSLNYQSGYEYRISSFSRKEENTFFSFLKEYNLINNKHIPNDYKINDRNIRLQVLAGLIDTDGHLIHGTYEIIQKSKQLMDDIIFIARSLGFMTTTKYVKKSCTYKNNIVTGYYYRTFISGNIHTIPVKLERKKASIRKQKKDVLKYGFDVIELGEDDYYGFILDGNHRYVLGNFIVTHNTCAAIGVAESNLHFNPNKKVYLIAPPNIQPNFERTIFDINNVTIPKEADVPNTHSGCTGNLYLQLTSTEYEKDRRVIERKVKQIVKTRYEVLGYYQLYSYIKRIMESVPFIDDLKERDIRINKKLDKAFSGHCMIIDEAHNLRDDEENMIDEDENELSNKAQGKKLTPALIRVLQQSYSMKLVLLTATPMYNKYSEILFLINLLLENDKRPTLKESFIFKNNAFTESGKKLFGNIIKNYVSYMRGETPITFPIRLKPFEGSVPRLKTWFSNGPKREQISLTDQQLKGLLKLPLIPVTYPDESYDDFVSIFEESLESSQLSLSSIDTMIQSGNWLYPSADSEASLEDRIRDIGFDNCFDSGAQYSTKSFMRFKSKFESASWLLESNLSEYSPKAAFIIKNIRKTEGAIFIYSRFIKSGALPLALALEANGYTPYGRDRTLLVDGIQDGKGRQCAKCSLREREHASETTHKFTPAKYILLTGNKSLSPRNSEMIDAERAKTNFDGSEVKIVIGSEVASEGIDLRYIREIYVFDSWYHLNRMEQVLGRGIRTCSHYLLPEEKRNCIVYLLVNVLKDQRESADIYMYRKAMLKSQQIGAVTRVIKEYALDCNLNIDVNIIKGLGEEEEIDAQGHKRKITFNDQDFTNMCDWMECEYSCLEEVDIDPEELDNLTYDDYTSQWRENQVKSKIRELFQKHLMMIRAEDITEQFGAIPSEALFSILHDIVNNKAFRIKVNNKEGYITYRNGYYLFQPLKLKDLEIPLSIRSAEYPVKQDNFKVVKEEVVVKEEIIEQDISGIELFWSTIKEWAGRIEEGSANTKTVSKSVIDAINSKFKYNISIANYINDQIHIILWLYKRMIEIEDYRFALSYVFLEYIWDYCLTYSEQISLAKKDDPIIGKVAEEQIMSDNIYRYVLLNEPYNMMYWCNNKLCSEIIIKTVEKDPRDSYNSLKANIETTGPFYGFLVPKKGNLSFKLIDNEKSHTADVGQSPPSGAVCSDVQTIEPKLKRLYKIGSLLKASGYPDFDLNEIELKNSKAKKSLKKEMGYPTNPNTYCALEEFILRWMDIKRVNRLRWFYRPIAAYKTGHYAKMTKPKVVREKKVKSKA